MCYDISDPKRLRKVVTICEDFVRMRNRLYEAIDLERDQVLFVSACGRCLEGTTTLGRPAAAPTARDAVIVT